mgnify:CR=1 FL=1
MQVVVFQKKATSGYKFSQEGEFVIQEVSSCKGNSG